MLEAASQLDTVVFDKTGTLTQGRPCVQQVLPTPGSHLTAADLLAYAAAVERCTSHPVAQAIVQAAHQSGQSAAAVVPPPLAFCPRFLSPPQPPTAASLSPVPISQVSLLLLCLLTYRLLVLHGCSGQDA